MNNFLQKFFCVQNVPHLLFARNFAFDGNRAVVAVFFQLPDQQRKVHSAVADALFLAQPVAVGGVFSVFRVHAHHEVAEYVQRVAGVALAV